ncbi:chromosome segregation protein SMC [Actinobaculum sp. 352]|uniref:chromosome segregation protein SMC n=1 Tax=Actinobaculum sp. 352 TaxID=2490946 RepID=UPI000F7F1171|nr:chromosome segregation protein SMC [Actinobaculum sp. 352]RTE49536.1 chromosome segregation protein SMC [Actinobaculum sp. 352]
MHLKTLTLRGFKSFASATTMRFEPGINCVVGPNGSGKSNVVDALAWVMGEQGVKTLRGSAMADVIFAGTSKRPALGRAEVALTIDNADSALPIDYTEVTISRTLFRSGGSEYAINGTSCRLLDIQELLSDTGMGREMHVVIGQGRLDAVLTANPEDRRGFIEEAAGVLKHRRRKEKALRKLESMQGSFTRIEDLTTELRRQLGPLAKQAEAARRAQIIQADARDARSRLLADDLAQQQARVQAEHVDAEKLAQQQAENARQVEAARERVAALEEAAAQASPELARLTEQWERLTSLEERFRSLGQVAAERVRSLQAATTARSHGETPEEIRQRAAEAQQQEDSLAEEVTASQDRLTQAIAEREKLEAHERTVERELAELNRAAADRREDAARLLGQIQTVTTRIESLGEEAERVATSLEAARARANNAATECARLEEDIVAASDTDDVLAITHEETSRELAAAQRAVAQARDAQQEAREQAAAWNAKADALGLSLVPEDATAWALESGPRITGVLREQLRVDQGWETALEAALAGAATAVVGKDLDAAVDTLRAAREAAAGHLEIVITSAGGADEREEENTRALAEAWKHVQPDVDAAVVALSVLEAQPGIQSAVNHLLAGAALAADLVTARKLIDAGAPLVATRQGDVLTAYRAWGGENSQASLLARQSAYEEALGQAQEAAQTAQSLARSLAEAESRLAEAEAENERTGAELAARDSKLAATTAQLGALRQTLANASEEVTRSEERQERLLSELEERRAALLGLQARQEVASTGPEAFEERVQEAGKQRDEAHQKTRTARQAETEARLHLRTREERLRAIAGRGESLRRQAAAVEERIRREEQAAQRRAVAAQSASEVGVWAQRALSAAGALRTQVGEKRAAADSSRSARETEISAARRHLDELQSAQRELADLGHRRELARAELRLRFEQLSAQALEELGMEAEGLIEEYGPLAMIPTEDGEVPYVREEQERRLARAERDLARLGKINPLALEEHAALEERQRYLAGQLMDLRKSRDDLLQIVRDLDEHIEDVLRSALADVADRFTEVFARLFPGGEGRLVLTDPDSPLTTGIEIEARPAGKRVKRLSLLSGGERSLTAIAFLVAIFMARPSPFYVMDEVEAALDDVNLSRLIEIFKELQHSSQLLIITHQKRTMEIADTLYGVAMREEGLTSVVSQRMRDMAPQ